MYFLPSLMFACCENQLAQYGYISKVLQYNQHQLIDFGQLSYLFPLSLYMYVFLLYLSFIFPLHVSVHYDTIYSSLIFSTSIKFSHTSLSRKTGIMIYYIVSAVFTELTHTRRSFMFLI